MNFSIFSLSTGMSIDTIQMIRIKKYQKLKEMNWLVLVGNTMQSPFKLIILLQHLDIAKITFMNIFKTTHWDKLYGLSHTNAFREGL